MCRLRGQNSHLRGVCVPEGRLFHTLQLKIPCAPLGLLPFAQAAGTPQFRSIAPTIRVPEGRGEISTALQCRGYARNLAFESREGRLT
jgi:hypothetical protein